MAVAKGIHSPSIRILSTCSRTLEAARKAARQLRIRIVSSEHWSMEHSSTLSYVESLSLGPNSAPPVVALLMEPAEMQTFMNEALTKRAARHVTWLLGCLGTIGPQVAAQWTMSLSNSAFLIEPHAPELAGLSQFLESKGLYSQPIENEVTFCVQIPWRFVLKATIPHVRFRTSFRPFQLWARRSICRSWTIATLPASVELT